MAFFGLFGGAKNSTDAAGPSSSTPSKPKPCCVCLDEKAARDECMLKAKSDDPAGECDALVIRYKECMAGFGFKL